MDILKTALLGGTVFTFISCGAQSHKQNMNAESEELTRIEMSVPVFEEDSAYKYMQQQVDFGFRIPNTTAHRATAEFLALELRRHGADVFIQEARVTAYNGTILNAKNIIGSYSPEKKDRVLLFAHWDSRPYADNDPDKANHQKPIMGANDGASGVGVLLEIARLVGERLPNIGIDIIFFDAEDYGQPYFYEGPENEDSWALGTQYWAARPHRPGYRARYGILLDMVGGKDAIFAREGFSQRYASGVNDKVWSAAQRLGYGKYFVNTEGGYITDDHVYVNRMGIPSIDIIQYDPNTETGFCKQWHTLDDTMDFIDKETLKAVGQTVLEIIYNE